MSNLIVIQLYTYIGNRCLKYKLNDKIKKIEHIGDTKFRITIIKDYLPSYVTVNCDRYILEYVDKRDYKQGVNNYAK